MDSWQGQANNPITLNKYLYANANPTMYTDPSGYMSLGSMMSGINTMSTLHSMATSTYDLLEQSVTGESEITAKDVGLAVLVSLGGKKLLSVLSRTCKNQEKCKYAKGFMEAEAKMINLAQTTPNYRLKKKAKPWKIVTVAGAFDIKKGRGTAATNGPVVYTPALENHARKFGLGLGDSGVCGTLNNVVGRCAEWRAASNLTRSGSDIKHIRWTQAHEVIESDNGFARLGPIKPPCGICSTVGFEP